MEKQYFYRKHIGKIQKSIPLVLGALVALYLIAALSLLIAGNRIDIVLKIIILVIGALVMTVFIVEGVFIWFLLRRFTKVCVTLTDDQIIYKNIKGENVVAIEELRKLEFPPIKYTGGWLKIIHPGGNIRLTVVLEGIGKFVKELKDILDRKGQDYAYDRKAMFSFYKTAEFADQSWDRLYGMFKKLMLFIGLSLLTGVLFFFSSGNLPLKGLWVMASFVLPTLIYSVSEFVIATAIARKSDEAAFEVPQRDFSFENKVYKTAIIIYSLFYIVVSSILMVISYM